MFPLWLYLFFTYLFTTYAIEETDSDKVFGKQSSAQSEGLVTSKLFNKISNRLLSEFNGSEDNLPELFPAIKSPRSSTIKEADNETDNDFLKILPLNSMNDLFKMFILPMFDNPATRRKRQTELSNAQLNEEKNLPINRLLDATDKLFNQTASIDQMLKNEESNSEKKYNHVYINDRNRVPDHEFTPIYKENVPKDINGTYSALLEKIFQTPFKSNFELPLVDSNQSVNNPEDVQRASSLLTQAKQIVTNLTNKSMLDVFDISGSTDGPLLSAGLLLIEKIKNAILNVVKKLEGDKKISNRVFAVSALTTFVLSVGVSATKAFYTGYLITERVCKFFTGKNGLVTCNFLEIFLLPIRSLRHLFTKISILFDFGKSFL